MGRASGVYRARDCGRGARSVKMSPRLNAAYVEMMGDHRPARTVIGVRELPKPGVLLTMNLTAVTAD